MKKGKEIEFGTDDKDEYLSHSVWTDEEEIDGVVEKEFYLSNSGVIEDKSTVVINNNYKTSFDDDINLTCRLGDLRLGLIQQYLYDIKSDLYEEVLKLSLEDLGKRLDIVEESSGALKVKNIGVLMFTEKPREFIAGSYIKLVHFENSSTDDVYITKIFDGPIHEQIRGVLRYVETNVLKLKSLANRTMFNYPVEAIKEAVINAVYHKNYQQNIPIEIRIDGTKFVIVSYPGADKFVDENEINEGEVIARIYRNLRIGEFLQSLSFATGDSTGLAKMIKAMHTNGSPKPIFKTDENRTYFSVRLNVNEAFLDEKQVSENEKQEDEEDLNLIEKKIVELLKDEPLSKKEIVNAFGYKIMSGDIKSAFDSLLDKKYIESTTVRLSSRNQRYRLIK